MTEKTYTEKFNRLKEITEFLENGQADIDTSLRYFEEGMGLVKACQSELNQIQEKVMILTDNDEIVPFEGESKNEL